MNKRPSSSPGRAQRSASGAPQSPAPRGQPPTLELYQKEDCPFSHAVRNRLTQLGLDFVAHNVSDDAPLKHEQLLRAGGKDQVPFLIDHTHGIKLYKSAAIVEYLDQTYGQPTSTRLGRFATQLDSQIRNRADQIAWRLRNPVFRARELQGEMQKTVRQVRGSLDFLKNRIDRALKPQLPRRRKAAS
ncbi:glutathione S-transferase N-terminal domain-containing protein [Bdellovibrionota bacterium FG-1]